MFSFIVFSLILSSVNARTAEQQQIIHIRVDEELPLSTILFTTSHAVTYRLFDTGRNQNAFVRYDSSAGQLLLARAVDREQLCAERLCSCSQCQLTIELIEWQLPYRLLQLILNIDDINDHVPRFSAKIFRLSLQENVPLGYELSLEHAHDADLGENSRLTYQLKHDADSDDGPFELLTKTNGALTLRVKGQIDREQRDHYEYQLIVSDNGQPKKHSSTKLFIQIEDLNDNPVVLAETHLRLNVSESTPIGTELTRINATDRDIGLNGKIHYSISHGLPSSSWMDYFRLGDSSGILSLVGPLDYESEQSYRLTVQVRDLGENSVAHFVTVDIYILDENDNRPQAYVTFVDPLVNDSRIFIRENSPIGQILAHVSISDQDSGLNGQMTSRIEQGNEWIGMKSIDQRSFLLIVDRLIDREEQSKGSDQLIVSISDHGQPSQMLRLEYELIIVDENDSPPQFNQSINCDLTMPKSDNQSIDVNDQSVFFQVSATDKDLDENGRISYSILPPYEQTFRINAQGQVFALVPLNQSMSYHLTIMAMDHGQPTRLNSTQNCSIVFIHDLDDIANFSMIPAKKLFPWSLNLFDRYSLLLLGFFILFLFVVLTLISLCLTFCFHTLFFARRRTFQQYHLYESVQRKSPFIHDESACSSKLDEHDDLTEEERERLVHSAASDQTSCESSDSMNKQIRMSNQKSVMRPYIEHPSYSRTLRNSYPPSPYLSTVVIPPPKPPRDCASVFHQQVVPGRPLSLSISTATTYTSSGADSSSPPPSMNTFRPTYSSFKHQLPLSSVARLAEEEKIDV